MIDQTLRCASISIATALLWLTLFLVASITPPVVVYPITAIGPANSRGIWPVEVNGALLYRWMSSESSLRLPNTDRGSLFRVTMRLTAPQYAGARSVAAEISSGNQTPVQFTIAPAWRRYHFLARAAESNRQDVVLHFGTEAWQSDNDQRLLGVAVSDNIIVIALTEPLRNVLERWFLLSAVCGIVLIMARRPWWLYVALTVGLTFILSGFAIWAPRRISEILPTAWWSVLEFLVMLTGVEAVRRRRMIPADALSLLGVVGTLAGTLLVSTAGWIAGGAMLTGCGALLSVYALIPTKTNHPVESLSTIRLRWRRHLLAIVGITLVYSWLLFPGLTSTSHYHGDESLWVHYPCTFNHGYAASWRTIVAKAS